MSRRWPRPGSAALCALAVAAVVFGLTMHRAADMPLTPLAEGLAFVSAGIAVLARWPERPVGWLMAVYPFLDWSFYLSNTRTPVLWTASGPLFLLSQSVLAYAILTFPVGRPRGRVEKLVVVLIAANLALQALELRFYDPRSLGCADCPTGLNMWVISPSTRVLNDLAAVNPVLVSLVLIPTLLIVLGRWARGSRPSRRVLGPVLLPAAAFIVANRIDGLTQAWYFWTGRLELFAETPLLRFLGHVEDVAVIVLPLGLLLGLARSRLDHRRVSQLVVELGVMPSTQLLEAALRRALRDEALRIALWDASLGQYLDRQGRAIGSPLPEGMVATRLERAGEPVALMVHDEALLEEPGLVEATAAAARLAVDNEQLRAEVEAQLAEVRASRQRIVSAQDEERRRIERDIHDGAQQRLVSLAMALEVAQSHLPEDVDPALRASVVVAAEEARAALVEVREFALGVHPAVLTQRGLEPALRMLADRSPVPVSLSVQQEAPRFAPTVETASYFVVAEGLTNVAKHASAGQIWVVVEQAGSELLVSVSDDGVGVGAAEMSSGLNGLMDRVRALGGELAVCPRAGGGTVLRARLPLESAQPQGAGRTER